MQADLRSVQDAFFMAMAGGWAQDARKIQVPELPGSKGVPFVWGDFRILDCYLVTTYSERSAGMTVIWCHDQPVWVMYYGGWYAKVAIPFLKSCLQRAYVYEHRFYGGRGPVFVRDERFTYVNKIERNDFSDFAGEERVFDLNELCLGYHWYRGMSLLNQQSIHQTS
ncbi:MAG: DUF5680 domain-containing protein [Patescibacteria group bacterium]